jgi:hypothetical protein
MPLALNIFTQLDFHAAFEQRKNHDKPSCRFALKRKLALSIDLDVTVLLRQPIHKGITLDMEHKVNAFEIGYFRR